jgi:hypothetical protein
MYKQKIIHFFCRPCGEYHLKTHPHYRAMKRRAMKRRKGSLSVAQHAGKAKLPEPVLGLSDNISEVPKEMKEIMRQNSQALREMITT